MTILADEGAHMTGNVDWLSSKDAAESLGITTRTLYRFINSGELPAYRFGRVIRLKRIDIETFIDASRIAPGTLDHLDPDAAERADAEAASDTDVEPGTFD